MLRIAAGFAMLMYVCFISCCMELVLTFIDYPRTLLMARFDIRTMLMQNCSPAHSYSQYAVRQAQGG
jgi:hypothetical protein